VVFGGTERFAIRRRIGAGAMGIVYEAWDHERGGAVALKVLRSPTPASVYRFKQEFRGLAGVVHPNLVALHELHAAGDAWFFTMELVHGVDLDTWVGRDEGRLRASLAQLAQGIAALHAAGRLHQDIKPSNVLVTADARVVLFDFGVIAEIGAANASGLGEGDVVLGTPAYMAPEQARGEVGPAADWYALGVVLHELLTGTRPFRGNDRATVSDKNSRDAAPVRSVAPGAPGDLAALCDALLARDPARRPGGAEVLRRLDVAAPPPHRLDVPELIGREPALATLRAAFAAARRGRGSVVHVHGPSGMGKSTLVGRFLDEVRRQGGAVVLAGRCYQQESVPYKAVDDLLDALARFLDGLPRDEVDAVLPRDAHLLAQVFPVLRNVEAFGEPLRREVDAEPREQRRRAFAALRELIGGIAERHPLVLSIDDAQWGDSDSAPVLDGLMHPPDPPAVVLVLAYRSEDAERGPLLRTLSKRRERLGARLPTIELPVEPLGLDEARAVAAAALGGGDPSSADAIARESGGVPFFIHELVRGAGAVGSLDGLVAARLAELGAEDRELVELIAQAAKPIALRTVASALGAGEPETARRIRRLAEARVVRTSDRDHGAWLECYHDRVREAVVGAIAAERSRQLHARLAATLAAEPAPDLEALAVHCERAGNRGAAAEYALRAAAQASAALAFERAAALYRTALALGDLGVERRREILRWLGDALTCAGEGAAAADAYLAAADGVPAADSLELRRLAASEYLRSGRLDSGLAILEGVLAEVGGKMPGSPARALLSLVAGRLRLWMRGLDFRRSDPSRTSAYDLARVDVLRSAATDLGMVDLIVGADFDTRQLVAALELGDPLRIARALTVEAMFLAARGPKLAARVEDVLGRAQVLVDELGDPQLPAWISAARGLAAYQAGRFRIAAEHSDTAVRQLRETVGAIWEIGGVEVQVLWSLWQLGELRELAARVDAQVTQARFRGNRFDEANLCAGLPALAWMVADRVGDGRAEVAHAMAQWSPRGFHLQHYYELLALTCFDLYEDRAAEARRRIDATWPALRRSRLMMCPSVEIEAWHLRGRVALALGDRAGARRALAVLRGWGEHPWAEAVAALAAAGLAPGPESFAAAAQRCAAADLRIFAAAATRRGAELAGDRDALDAADRAMTGEGVADPARFARSLVPRLDDGPRSAHASQLRAR
jgi:hypothetical protein